MKSLRALFPFGRRWRDAAILRRVMRIWIATGSIPVAHMVADLDWTAELPTRR
jgi:hypothetical protein